MPENEDLKLFGSRINFSNDLDKNNNLIGVDVMQDQQAKQD